MPNDTAPGAGSTIAISYRKGKRTRRTLQWYSASEVGQCRSSTGLCRHCSAPLGDPYVPHCPHCHGPMRSTILCSAFHSCVAVNRSMNMSWILREGTCMLSVRERFTLPLLLEMCPYEQKWPFRKVHRSSAGPKRTAISFEPHLIQPNLHRQTLPFRTTLQIEYP